MEIAAVRDASSSPPLSFKKLVRFGAVTYRIHRLRYAHYEIVRIVDDQRLGTFRSYPRLDVLESAIHPAFLLRIALAAAEGVRPSLIERLTFAWRRRALGPGELTAEEP